MECPYCGKKLEEGTITGDRYAIKWVADDTEAGKWRRKRIRVTPSWPDIQHAAFFCPECKKVIVDVSDMMEW